MPTFTRATDRRLYEQAELPALLDLDSTDITWLINTGQLCPIRICGEVRFDSREIDQLIATYRQIATRKAEHVH